MNISYYISFCRISSSLYSVDNNLDQVIWNASQKQKPDMLCPEACNFIKKETLAAQVFSCEFCETSKNNFPAEHLRTTSSGIYDEVVVVKRI